MYVHAVSLPAQFTGLPNNNFDYTNLYKQFPTQNGP